MRPIIVPIDFSDCSLNALEHAFSIAKKGGIDITMVWVKQPQNPLPLLTEAGQNVDAVVETEFKRLVNKYQPQLNDSVIDFKLREGRVSREILSEAEDSNAFLIVTGTHGVSGFEERWMGSNANKIVSDAPCPVITIRGVINIGKDLKTIVMPVDSTSETRQKVPLTAMIAKMFHSEVHILVMYSTKVAAVRRSVEGYMEQSARYFKENKVPVKVEGVEVKKPVDDILNFATRVDANLISIMSEMETSVKNWWLGSYTQQLTNNSPFPVLVSHPKEFLQGSYGF